MADDDLIGDIESAITPLVPLLEVARFRKTMFTIGSQNFYGKLIGTEIGDLDWPMKGEWPHGLRALFHQIRLFDSMSNQLKLYRRCLQQ